MRIAQRAINAVWGLFNNLDVSTPKAWNENLWNLANSKSLSGETVTVDTSLTYSAVWNATNLISGTISSLPLRVMQSKGDSTLVASKRPLYRVLHDQANRYMTAKTFRETLMSHVLLWGNGYAEKVKNPMGDVVELWPISPNRVTPMWHDGELVYQINMPDGENKILTREKILHVSGLGNDGIVGYSVISMAQQSIGLGMAIETFGSLYFGQGTHPGAIVSHPKQLSPTAHDNLKKSLVDSYSGLGKSHRLMLLEEGMKIESLGFPPNDSQFLESRQFQISEIARWFNLPPHKLKDLTKSSFSNIESEQRSFYTDSLLPWLVTLEQNFNMQLLTELERSAGYYTKHQVEGILRADAAGRAAFYSSQFMIGAMSINEIRKLEELDPIKGGDTHFVPMNMTPLEDVGKEPKQPAEPTTDDDKE